MEQAIQSSFQQALNTLTHFCHPKNYALIAKLSHQMAECLQTGNKLIICGNGGSACDAMHFAEELTGRYRKNRPPLAAIALADPAHITCVANDFGYSEIFSRSIEALAKPEDWLIVMSTSGNSDNIIQAVDKAKQMNLHTLSLLGKDGGKVKGQCDFEFIIPALFADRIQEMHMLILHVLVEGIERILFPQNYDRI